MKSYKPAYLLIAHGTRNEKGIRAFLRFAEEFQRLMPERWIQASFLELAKPSIREGIDACIGKGAREIFIVPLMLFPGRHVNEDIPKEIEAAKRSYPEADFHYTGPLAVGTGESGRVAEPKMFELLIDKISRMAIIE